MHRNLNSRFTIIVVLTLHLITSAVPTVSSQELQFSENGNVVELKHNQEHEHVKILHFPNQQIFIDKFGEDEQIAQVFSNYTISKPDKTVPGDMGAGYVIENAPEEIQQAIDEGYKIYAFNKYVSDIIPVQRRLRDNRNEWCFTPDRILKNLLPTSVIMCFYNEALSTLLRSIYSILDRSPPHLLSEIILIDDFSEYDELKDELESRIQSLPKVRLIRLKQREGLIRARLIGADLAVAPILTFLDSHVETSEGWLESLLDRVTRSWTTIAIPYLDHLDRSTLEYKASSDDRIVGGFTWDLLFSWKGPGPQDMKDVKTLADPFTSPTMPGGLFSIHRDFFEYLSKFDEDFDVWGAENLELSFKAWMCGGRIEIVPCSRIAHLERGISPYERHHYKKNTYRLARVWLDEYIEFYYAENVLENDWKFENLDERLAIKERMNCSSFDWYMKNVVPDMFNPKTDVVARGEVKNLDFSEIYCLDAHLTPNATVELPSLFWKCHGIRGNQYWYYSTKGEIRNGKQCLDYFGEDVSLLECHGLQGNQHWEHHADTGVVIHSVTQQCLTLEETLGKVVMSECQGEMNQRWKFQHDKSNEVFKDFDFEWRSQELRRMQWA